MRTKFTFHHDPGHGWIEVYRSEAKDLGILNQISQYSYESAQGTILYLEEDCDAALFVAAYKTRYNTDPVLVESDRGEFNFIRNLGRFYK